MNTYDGMSGAAAIATERQRQINEEGYPAEHDDTHDGGELAMAAVCYAAPERVFIQRGNPGEGFRFEDPWPWTREADRRRRALGALLVVDPRVLGLGERIDLLIKAGALIAAEVDRLKRALEKQKARHGARTLK